MGELRYNYLWNTWVVVAPERKKRPHDFVLKADGDTDISRCPFEYGKEHLTPAEVFALRDDDSAPNTPGWRIRVVPNRYPALSPSYTPVQIANFHTSLGGYGFHEVVVETPHHYRHLHCFSLKEVEELLWVYRERMRTLYAMKEISYVLVFKNYGQWAGASLSHPHSQIIAMPLIPPLVKTVIGQFKRFLDEEGGCYLCAEIDFELSSQVRVVYQNPLFLVYAPFYSYSPFQIRIAPKEHLFSFADVEDHYLKYLSDALKTGIGRLFDVLENPCYNLYIHTCSRAKEEFFHWYLDVIPRITHIAGFELGGGVFINPVSPEQAAQLLRKR